METNQSINIGDQNNRSVERPVHRIAQRHEFDDRSQTRLSRANDGQR